MKRLLVLSFFLTLGTLVAFWVNQVYRSKPAQPLRVPSGDAEIAWFNITTSGQVWERFIAGIHQAARQNPQMKVDDSEAFLDRQSAIPEVVLSFDGRPGKLRIRWYKLSSDMGVDQWIDLLASRSPPPVAIMGGGSSDRATDLARALAAHKEWNGEPPLLFITTATANEVFNSQKNAPELLTEIYPHKTFRFCFTDASMAQAVVDFVWQQPELRPHAFPTATGALPLGAGANSWSQLALAPLLMNPRAPRAYILSWQDDPYSIDLAYQFHRLFHEKNDLSIQATADLRQIPYSVGTFYNVNRREEGIAEDILAEMSLAPGQRSLLVLPTATQPARRMVKAFATDSPLIGRQLVAVTGDGISFNTLYRDGDVAWPVRDLAIPLVLFTHQNPVAWDQERLGTERVPMLRPNSTDDVLLFRDMIEVIVKAAYRENQLPGANDLAKYLRDPGLGFFEADGNRRSGQGEYVVVVKPQFSNPERIHRDAIFEVFTRSSNHRWELVQRLTK